MSFDHRARVGHLQALMEDTGVDAVLLSVGADLPYFTGYEAKVSERLTVLVVPGIGTPVMFVPQLEAPRVEPGEFEVRAWPETEDPVEAASTVVASPKRVGVGDQMWSVFLTRFQKRWTDAEWLPASQLTAPLRLRKDPHEVELLRKAAHGVDRVMGRIPAEVTFSGRSESAVARELAELTVAEGHDLAAFTIVAAGPNGASPHHEPGGRVIESGDVVVCDFGGRVGGYFSDSTRTFVVGEPDRQALELHDVVARAAEAGRDAVEPGISCEAVDRAARAVVEDAGHGDGFIHRTGHGIGLDVHEHPYIVEGNRTSLEAGMAFSVEPGVYLPGRLGVRIEDIVVCTDDGADVLNESSRDLVVVG